MTNQNSDLFTNRSTTREFLFSHSKDRTEPQPLELTKTGEKDTTEILLDNDFSEMLSRQELMETIDRHLSTAPSIVAMALEIKGTDSAISQEDQTKVFSKDTLLPIAKVCRTNAGTWAHIGHHRFACVFPDLDKAAVRQLAENLLPSFHGSGHYRITIGIATYPTINYTRSQIVENAEKALDHAGFLDPGTITPFDAISLNISGDRHYQAGDIPGAIDEFKKGLLLNPMDVNLHNSLGVCYGVLKDYDNALASFENAVWLAPDDIMGIYNKGYVLLTKEKRKEALACFFEANEKEPDVFEVVFHIGQTLMEMGDIEKARPFLETSCKVNNRSGPALKSLGNCLEQLSLTKKAIQAYKGVVKINPSDAKSLSTLGGLYVELGESLDVASVFCEQSVRLSPENGLYRYRLGCTYLSREMIDFALKEFEGAEALGHDSRTKIEEIHNKMMSAKAS